MAGLTGVSNQSPRITTGFLNTVNDPAPGVPVSTAQISGSIVQPYGGQLGGKLYLSADDAKKLSSSDVGTLYGGVYMYVRLSASAVAANAIRGRIVVWDLTAAEDQYQVTTDLTQNESYPLYAGVALNPPATTTAGQTGQPQNTLTPGNYGFIQIAGKSTMQVVSSGVVATTKTLVVGANGAVNGIASAGTFGGTTATTFVRMSDWVGDTEALLSAIVANALIPVDIKPGGFTLRQ